MERRSEKTLLTLLTLAGGLGLGLFLAPKAGQGARRVLSSWFQSAEQGLETQLERISEQLSVEAAHMAAEIIEELIPQFEEPEEEWEQIYRDLVEELERLPSE